jgi:hypothetical protein
MKYQRIPVLVDTRKLARTARIAQQARAALASLKKQLRKGAKA